MQAAEVDDQVEAERRHQIDQARDVAAHEGRPNASRGCVASGKRERFRHDVDACNRPPVTGEVDAVGAAAAAQIERAAWRKRAHTFDQFHQTNRRNAALPNAKAKLVEGSIAQRVPTRWHARYSPTLGTSARSMTRKVANCSPARPACQRSKVEKIAVREDSSSPAAR